MQKQIGETLEENQKYTLAKYKESSRNGLKLRNWILLTFAQILLLTTSSYYANRPITSSGNQTPPPALSEMALQQKLDNAEYVKELNRIGLDDPMKYKTEWEGFINNYGKSNDEFKALLIGNPALTTPPTPAVPPTFSSKYLTLDKTDPLAKAITEYKTSGGTIEKYKELNTAITESMGANGYYQKLSSSWVKNTAQSFFTTLDPIQKTFYSLLFIIQSLCMVGSLAQIGIKGRAVLSKRRESRAERFKEQINTDLVAVSKSIDNQITEAEITISGLYGDLKLFANNGGGVELTSVEKSNEIQSIFKNLKDDTRPEYKTNKDHLLRELPTYSKEINKLLALYKEEKITKEMQTKLSTVTGDENIKSEINKIDQLVAENISSKAGKTMVERMTDLKEKRFNGFIR